MIETLPPSPCREDYFLSDFELLNECLRKFVQTVLFAAVLHFGTQPIQILLSPSDADYTYGFALQVWLPIAYGLALSAAMGAFMCLDDRNRFRVFVGGCSTLEAAIISDIILRCLHEDSSRSIEAFLIVHGCLTEAEWAGTEAFIWLIALILAGATATVIRFRALPSPYYPKHGSGSNNGNDTCKLGGCLRS